MPEPFVFPRFPWSADDLSAQYDASQADDFDAWLPWLAVVGAWLCFGSFAVPMKWQSVADAEVHPLVFQCYKTFWTFVTSHAVLIFLPYEITWWGILSGLSWVPAGVAAVVAVQNVGIAYGQAVWQVTIIVTSFVWGFAIIGNERVHSWYGTAGALVCLMFGVVGMTFAFNLQKVEAEWIRFSKINMSMVEPLVDGDASELPAGTPAAGSLAGASQVNPGDRLVEPQRPSIHASREIAASFTPMLSHLSLRSRASSAESYRLNATTPTTRRSMSDLRYALDNVKPDVESGANVEAALGRSDTQATSATLGIGAALFNGIWGGSNLVPSTYAPLHGIHFVLSFSTGALIVNAVLILIYVLMCKTVWQCAVPSPHFRTMAVPGFISGSLWSAGNFCSLYVVNHIGQGIGYSLVQSSVIVSGLWGILFYREMSGRPVLYWSICCVICLVGVFTLAREKAS